MNPPEGLGLRPSVRYSAVGWAVLVAVLAGCSADEDVPVPVTSPPAVQVSSGGPSAPAVPPASPSEVQVPRPVPPSTATPPPLPPQVQQELDQRLVAAAKANDAALAAELIRSGANVNAKDAIQDSAFLYAGAEGFNEILLLTLANGADVASTNRFGGTALIPASEHGHVDTVRILIAAGVPVNHVNNLGWTAMQEAILLNNGGPRQQEVVRQLLAAGADPDIRDPQGRTALQNAERLGFGAIAKLIREREQPG
ncbi:ankyrin repeat protein [Arthrobacter sp. V4I6]|uniref:ankyrin repeat domain-containing protein n=1 Tax=unclassified Arthrobacter TaxID=235627 RepID=UPI0027812FFF|nr:MULTISPECIES: ankyrin repeat domain-containing protein [unclassified Arthrobacter]MDQ0822952.1 ankyrin repeat protein [Arthrobacter sp. V1I7]MDQ0852581.1 ankyrin repeat protein [Arthrobacter sp. V4I6]